MTTWETIIRRRREFEVVLDAWPDGAQGEALDSLIAGGDVAAAHLPYGFVGLTYRLGADALVPGSRATSYQANTLAARRARTPVSGCQSRSDRCQHSRLWPMMRAPALSPCPTNTGGAPWAKIRVMLANIPPTLRPILRDLVNRQPDMAIVGEVRTLAELPPAVASLRAAAVILTLSPPATGRTICGALRKRHPALTLLGLAQQDNQTEVWLPHTSPRTIQLSATGILTALRGQTGQIRPQ